MSDTFLDNEDVAKLTGIKRDKRKQCAHLRSIGIRFYQNAKGEPVVPRAVVEGLSVETKQDTTWSPALA